MSKTTNNGPAVPRALLEAMKRGEEITFAQLRQLIDIEAQALGLTFAQAVDRGRRHALPRTVLGGDLSLLVEMLPA